jgi:hypothetical protein
MGSMPYRMCDMCEKRLGVYWELVVVGAVLGRLGGMA